MPNTPPQERLAGVRLLTLTGLVLTAFAANSLLCRSALAGGHFDALGFAIVRLAAGAVFLLVLVRFFERQASDEGVQTSAKAALPNAFFLGLYCVSFSYAYVTIDAGIGALILFGAVQATMLVAAVLSKEQLGLRKWLGLALALAGLGYLVLGPNNPQLATAADTMSGATDAPSSTLLGSCLMAIAGIAWGGYTLLGRGNSRPVRLTQQSFLLCLPFCIGAGIIAWNQFQYDDLGLILAVISGAITSGLGYALWYRVLPSYSRNRAAILQLLVPILAAIGGIAFLGESISIRLLVGGGMILGGVALSLANKRS